MTGSFGYGHMGNVSHRGSTVIKAGALRRVWFLWHFGANVDGFVHASGELYKMTQKDMWKMHSEKSALWGAWDKNTRFRRICGVIFAKNYKMGTQISQ